MNELHWTLVISLHVSVFLGLAHEWGSFLNVETWIIWFLGHTLVYSLYVIYIEFFKKTTDMIEKNILYHSFFIVLWYYQRIYVLTNQSVQNFEIGCKRDLLVLTTTVTFTIILLAFSGMFSVLIS